MRSSTRIKRFGLCAVSALASIAVIGCQGRSSTSSTSVLYTVGGSVSGLTGAGLVLLDNGSGNLSVSANATSFTFPNLLPSGSLYNVTVLTQPAGESCAVSDGSGTASSQVTGVSIACKAAYTIGGSVYGLTGTGLVLQDNSGNNVAVASTDTSYVFTFDGAIPSGGAPYSITVLSNPAGQACTVSGATGTATANVSNANVSCSTLATTTFTIAGTVTGLTGPGLILQDALSVNNNDLLPVNANGTFTFVNPVASGGSYNVTVLTQPSGRNCSVTNGTGTATANVTNVTVACVGQWTWIGGSSTVGTNGGQAGIYGTLGAASPTNVPGGREQALTWTDKAGKRWLFGGYGQDSTGMGYGGLMNDLWKFDPAQGTSGEWTWLGGSTVTPPSPSFGAAGAPGVYGTLGTASPDNVPGGREQMVSWLDASGNLWLFGGEANDSFGNTGELNDMWMFNPTLGTNGEWTWMGGSSSVPSLFGGPSGVYGNMGTASPLNVPGGRYGSISWTDKSGNFWLFGGDGVDSTGAFGYLNDLWEYTPGANATPGQWTWQGGYATEGPNGGQAGTYGTLGTPDAGNLPGARDAPASWVDASGNVWLFGGIGIDSTGTFGYLNDLWEYTPGTDGAAGVWTWMGGTSTLSNPYSGQPGVYGTLGLPAAANIPGGRFSPVSWTDASGNLWLASGQGYDAGGNQGYLNDLWKYTPAANGAGQWTWVSGGNNVGRTGGLAGVYGILGVPSSTDVIGGRLGASGWTDASGDLLLFGGQGYDANGSQGYLNDTWEFQP
jgi:hypothetical protein